MQEGKIGSFVYSLRQSSLTIGGNHRLIAIMLGRFAMTVDECIEKYEELIPLIFAKPRRLYFKTSLLPRHKHDAKALEIAIKGIVESRSGRSGTILKQPNENMCGV